ncbi:MAG: Fic family protein [Deltaproteobacteria bacterium]|nr:Fic family protein [Deltaproteobacteria bacterium]
MVDIYHKWEPITDLPANSERLRDKDFESTAQLWLSVRNKIPQNFLLEYQEKINRHWAIEIGQVENLYQIDNNITEILIEYGLKSVELPHQTSEFDFIDPNLFLESHKEAIEVLYLVVKNNEKLSHFLINSLHSIFVEHQHFAVGMDPLGRKAPIPLTKGLYKRYSNNPLRPDGLIHQYCPPTQTRSEMDRLLLTHEEHTKKNTPVEIEAAWFHHRFTQIHPFQDGNGRLARALTSLIFLRAGFLPPVVTAQDKDNYLATLDLADKGDLQPFISYLASIVVAQTRRLLDSLPGLSLG